MQIIPINFQKRHKEMLQWTYTLMSQRFIRIHPSFHKLIVSLRTAVVIDDWKLDKQQHRMMIYWIHLDSPYAIMSLQVTDVLYAQ